MASTADRHCRDWYEKAIGDPQDRQNVDRSWCRQCERGKQLYFEKGGRDVGTYKNKLCVVCQKSGQVKDERCYKCYKIKHGKPPWSPPAKDIVTVGKQGNKKHRTTKSAVCGFHKNKGKSHKDAPVSLTLDFSGHPELYNRLTILAREEHRTPELQARHIIHRKFLVEDLRIPEASKKPKTQAKTKR